MIIITVIIAIPFYVIIIAIIYGVRTVYADIKRALPRAVDTASRRQINTAARQFVANRALRREFVSVIAKNIGADDRLVESPVLDMILRRLASEVSA